MIKFAETHTIVINKFQLYHMLLKWPFPRPYSTDISCETAMDSELMLLCFIEGSLNIVIYLISSIQVKIESLFTSSSSYMRYPIS